MTARELTELILKFEELKEKYSLNYIIYIKLTDNDGKYIQNYNIQSLNHFGELLDAMSRGYYNVTVTHITSHINTGRKGD